MKLRITIEDRTRELEVPDHVISEAEGFFAKMDKDMDRGWQIGPDYVENPDLTQRCQIAADKILQAVDTENHDLLQLMAGYILARMPDVAAIDIDTSGDPQSTTFAISRTGPGGHHH